MTPRCSVVLTSYERPRHLALVLEGYRRQTLGDFELIVADDGSGPETRAVVERFAASAPFPVRHLWHERDGHRRTVILNRGIAEARSDYVVFSDGDCIPAADFLAVHLQQREPARMLIAGYVRIDPEAGARLDAGAVAQGVHETWVTADQRRALWRRHRRNQWQILRRRRRRPHNLAANMSVARAALVRVNGYDERFRGWGNADGDLRERLRMTGVRLKSIWPHALVFHLDHPVESSRRDAARNRAYAKRPDVPAFAEQGLVKPGAPGASRG
jgi:glycosyltransferase involved in cell wall biosynthesis